MQLVQSRDAMLLAGIRAVEDKKAKAEAQLTGAEKMEAAAADARVKAEKDFLICREIVKIETAAARQLYSDKAAAAEKMAEDAAAAAKAAAQQETAAAKAEAAAELQEGQKQLDKAIKAHGGSRLELQQVRECVVCFEEYLGFDDGLECSSTRRELGAPHFVCNGCFVASVQSSITDDMAKQTMREGLVACPYSTFPRTANSCDSVCFDGKRVAEKVDEGLWQAFQRQRDKLTGRNSYM